MKKTLLRKVLVLVLSIITLSFLITNSYAKYILTGNYIGVSTKSNNFYFDSSINKDYDVLDINQADFEMYLKNYISDIEYNDYNTLYEVITDNENFGILLEDENEACLTSGIKDNTVKVSVFSDNVANLPLENNFNLVLKSVSPYYKEMFFPVKIINNAALIGDYVEYDVGYTDMYTNYEFTSVDGWRILDPGTRNNDGTYSNTKIISTGIPMKLYYNASQNPNTTTNANSSWWGTASEVNSRYGLNLSAWGSSNSRYFAAYGLEYNFVDIPLTVGSAPAKNKGGYIKITNSEASSTANGLIFMNSNSKSVHAVTVEEMNKALNSVNGNSNRSDKTLGTVNASVDKRAMFYLRGLENYNYSSSTVPPYWLGSPNDDNTGLVRFQAVGTFAGGTDNTYGVRPVIVLNKKIYKEDGIWKIVN